VPARGRDGPGSATVIVSLALLGLHVSVDRIGDGRIGATRLVLVDDRGTLAVVTHPRHQVFESHAAPGRPRVPRVPEIMKLQAFRADRPHSVRPGRLPVEVPAPRPHLHRAYLDAERRRNPTPELTPRQWELLRLVAAGHTNAQIARQLGLSEGTVHIHLQNIYARLQVPSRTAAVTRAFPDLAAM